MLSDSKAVTWHKINVIFKLLFFSLVDRFTGRPGAYIRLINRWKLEEVSNYFAFPLGNSSKALWILVVLNWTLSYYCTPNHRAFNPPSAVSIAASSTYGNKQGNNTHWSGPRGQKAWAGAFRCWANVPPVVPMAAEMEMEKFSVKCHVQSKRSLSQPSVVMQNHDGAWTFFCSFKYKKYTSERCSCKTFWL